jgi:hypothetical protein
VFKGVSGSTPLATGIDVSIQTDLSQVGKNPLQAYPKIPIGVITSVVNIKKIPTIIIAIIKILIPHPINMGMTLAISNLLPTLLPTSALQNRQVG